jgi:hypothetical protein
MATVCALIVIIDVARRPQKMWIMNLVWPLTMLYGGVVGLWFYFAIGRQTSRRHMHHLHETGQEMPGKTRPFWQTVAIGTTHCGSGCTVADILAEWAAFVFPPLLAWFGYRALWRERIFSVWILDYLAALLVGVAFQYFAIVPMRKLPPGKGMWVAFKVDVLSLTAWQAGMYGWMAIVQFVIFHNSLATDTPAFWFMMQIGMLAGFVASFPANWCLIRSGIKEKM